MFYGFVLIFINLFNLNHIICSKNETGKNLSIFVLTNKDFQPKFTKKVYKIITESKSSLKGNYSLDVIYSESKNDRNQKIFGYNGFSNFFFLWKNFKKLPKFVGIIWNNNYFKFLDEIPDVEYIFKSYDIILPKQTHYKPSIREHFGLSYIKLLDDILYSIKKKSPEYFHSAIKTLCSDIIYLKNIFIMKREDFFNYGTFVFDIMKELGLKYDMKLTGYHKSILKNEKKINEYILEIVSNIYFNSFKNKYEIEAVGQDFNFGFMEEKTFLQKCLNGSLLESIPEEKINPKISIVVPIYNKEKYFVNAIRSIQNQRFKDFEIVLVDDGSKDRSVEIMEEEAKKDKRIKIVKNGINRGTLFTRYNGALHSSGKYIMQLDADDALCNPNSLKILFNVIENQQVEIVHFSVIKGKLKNLRQSILASCNEGELITQPELTHYLKKLDKSMYEWNKIYKREVYLKAFEYIGKVFYEEHHCYLQDKIVTFSIFKIAKSMYTIQDIFIWYNLNKDSGTKAKFSDKKIYDAYRTMTFLEIHSKDTIEEKIEFNKAIEKFFIQEPFIKGVFFSKKYNIYYQNFCKKHLNSQYLLTSTKEILFSFCNKIQMVPKGKKTIGFKEKYLSFLVHDL